jgi:hypothetical protein
MQLVLDYIHTCIFLFFILYNLFIFYDKYEHPKKHDLYSRETRKASGKLT